MNRFFIHIVVDILNSLQIVIKEKYYTSLSLTLISFQLQKQDCINIAIYILHPAYFFLDFKQVRKYNKQRLY